MFHFYNSFNALHNNSNNLQCAIASMYNLSSSWLSTTARSYSSALKNLLLTINHSQPCCWPLIPGCLWWFPLMTVFSQLFVGEVVCIFDFRQRASATAEAFSEVFENHCHCTPVTGTEISQTVARRAVGARMCQVCRSRPEQSRAGPSERRRLVHSSFLSLCMMSGVLCNILSKSISPNWCHCQCWRTFLLLSPDTGWNINELPYLWNKACDVLPTQFCWNWTTCISNVCIRVASKAFV